MARSKKKLDVRRTFLFISLAAAVVLVAVGSRIPKKESTNPIIRELLSQTPTPSSGVPKTPTPTTDPNGHWQTYRNTELGFAVSYPPDWTFGGEDSHYLKDKSAIYFFSAPSIPCIGKIPSLYYCAISGQFTVRENNNHLGIDAAARDVLYLKPSDPQPAMKKWVNDRGTTLYALDYRSDDGVWGRYGSAIVALTNDKIYSMALVNEAMPGMSENAYEMIPEARTDIENYKKMIDNLEITGSK